MQEKNKFNVANIPNISSEKIKALLPFGIGILFSALLIMGVFENIKNKKSIDNITPNQVEIDDELSEMYKFLSDFKDVIITKERINNLSDEYGKKLTQTAIEKNGKIYVWQISYANPADKDKIESRLRGITNSQLVNKESFALQTADFSSLGNKPYFVAYVLVPKNQLGSTNQK